jgi:hypothetical protein
MAPIFTGSKFGFGRVDSAGPSSTFSASGGTTFTPGDGYKYHFFISPQDFIVTSSPGTVDYIIIGGGGAGCGQPSGNNYGGGGAGAGGVRTGSITATTGTNPFVVGATSPASTSYSGAIGNPSSALGITAQGGGSGGGYNQTPTNLFNGGSGGGAPHYDPSTVGLGGRVTGTTTPAPDTGNNGGLGGSSASGGGGGAGGVGGNSTPTSIGGKGGLGMTFPGWTIPPSYGTTGPSPGRWFAGGGGGGGNSGGGAAPDGGGGGAGSDSTNATPGTANTGGGGGSTGGDGPLSGGNGASGIIMVRYLV